MPECCEGPSGADGDELDNSRCPGDVGIALHPSRGAVGHVHRIPGCERNATPLPISRYPEDITLAGGCLNAITRYTRASTTGCARCKGPTRLVAAPSAGRADRNGM